MAYDDELTGLPARRALNEALARLRGTYTVAMVDIDHFKRFNDEHGHDVGDQILRMVGARLAGVGGGGGRSATAARSSPCCSPARRSRRPAIAGGAAPHDRGRAVHAARARARPPSARIAAGGRRAPSDHGGHGEHRRGRQPRPQDQAGRHRAGRPTRRSIAPSRPVATRCGPSRMRRGGFVSPLATWFTGPAAIAAFRRRTALPRAGRPPCAQRRLAGDRAGLRDGGGDGRGRPAVSDRGRATLRSLRQRPAARRGAGDGRDGVPAAGASGAAAAHAAHRGAAVGVPGAAARGVLVSVRGRGSRSSGYGTAPRRPGRRVLASARGAAHADAGPARSAGHAQGSRSTNAADRPRLANARPRPRDVVPPAAVDAAQRDLSRPFAGAVTHLAGSRRARPAGHAGRPSDGRSPAGTWSPAHVDAMP